MSTIIPHKLYLGNILNVHRLPWMDKHNINTIICVASPKDVSISKLVRAHKTVHQFDIADREEETLDFEPIIRLIDESMTNGAVLVNCAVGMSRSPTFVIAYLMKTQQIPLRKAYRIVKTARPKINPNQAFMKQLEDYERTLFENPPPTPTL